MSPLLLLLLVLFQDPRAPGDPPQREMAEAVGEHGIIGAEDRELLPDFIVPEAADQAAARAGLGATHRLSCGASASLVHRSDTIIFSAHQLLYEGKPDPDVAHCFFEVSRVVDGKVEEERYPLLLDTLDQGRLVAAKGDGHDLWNADNQRDWAIVRLARPVPGIVPYRLPDGDAVLQPGDAVTTVSGKTDNWKGSSEPKDRLVQSCKAVPAPSSLARFPAVTHLDCDVGGGASGGAVLREAASGHPLYVGTIIAYTGNGCRVAGLESCFSIARRLDAGLVARIEGTTALRTTPEDVALGAAQDARLAAARDETARAAAAALAAPFPAQDDAAGREVAALSTRIESLIAAGQARDTDPLLIAAFRALHDPDQGRPEWSRLLIDSGDAMRLQHRPLDALQGYRAALAVSPDALKPYLRLRMAQATSDDKERAADLREAYLAGGDALFRAAGADDDLAAIKARGTATTE